MTNPTPNDPMEFMKNMWGNMGFALPGMVTPTVDTDELGKRITDLKAVEGWLKSNLSLLQMSIQGLEMQRNTLMTLQQMSQAAQSGRGPDSSAPANPFLNPAAWPMPWNLMGNTAVPPAPTFESTMNDVMNSAMGAMGSMGGMGSTASNTAPQSAQTDRSTPSATAEQASKSTKAGQPKG